MFVRDSPSANENLQDQIDDVLSNFAKYNDSNTNLGRTILQNNNEEPLRLKGSSLEGFQEEMVEDQEMMKEQEYLWKKSGRPRESKTTNRYIQCDICYCMFKGKKVLREHKKYSHGKRVICKKCNGSFS